MADNKIEEGQSNQKTALKINTGEERLLVAHVALLFIYALYHFISLVDFILLIQNSFDTGMKSAG